MAEEYEKNVRDYYKSSWMARAYHERFTAARGGRALRYRLVAYREQQVVKALLRRVPHGRVLDIPAGTGKLAAVFQALSCDVLACDVSQAMLDVAEQQYRALRYGAVSFRLCDIEELDDLGEPPFDVTVCVRLLHLVPPERLDRVLGQLARSAPYVVATFGVTSAYERLRHRVRTALLGGDARGQRHHLALGAIRRGLRPRFRILDQRWVVPAMSSEVAFLLESRPMSAS